MLCMPRNLVYFPIPPPPPAIFVPSQSFRLFTAVAEQTTGIMSPAFSFQAQEGGSGRALAEDNEEEEEEGWESASEPDDFDQSEGMNPTGLVISLAEGIRYPTPPPLPPPLSSQHQCAQTRPHGAQTGRLTTLRGSSFRVARRLGA